MAHNLRAWVRALSRRDWLCLVAIAYFGVLAIELVLTRSAMRWIDQHYPGMYFYHLDEGESPGPLGDLDAAWLAILIGYAILSVLFVPAAIFLQIPFLGTVALFLLKEPAETFMFIGLAYLAVLLGI